MKKAPEKLRCPYCHSDQIYVVGQPLFGIGSARYGCRSCNYNFSEHFSRFIGDSEKMKAWAKKRKSRK